MAHFQSHQQGEGISKSDCETKMFLTQKSFKISYSNYGYVIEQWFC